MTKYKLINGFTKKSVMEAIRKGNNGTKALYHDHVCQYLTEEGNKCFVGCFIPEGHRAQREAGNALQLMGRHDDLPKFMPLAQGLQDFQDLHDNYSDAYEGTLHEVAEKWLEENTEEASV